MNKASDEWHEFNADRQTVRRRYARQYQALRKRHSECRIQHLTGYVEHCAGPALDARYYDDRKVLRLEYKIELKVLRAFYFGIDW